MALPVETPSRETPEHTTLASFTLHRLKHPVLAMTFVETKDAWWPLPLRAVLDLNEDQLFEVIELEANTNPALSSRAPSLAAGMMIYTPGGVELSTISAVEVVGGFTRLTLNTPLAEAPTAAKVPFINHFGARAHTPINEARKIELSLHSSDSTQAQRLQQALGEIHVEAVLTVLAAMNIEATQEAVLAAVVALSQQGINLESMIASGLERIETARRAEQFSPTTVVSEPLIAGA